jgi:hypothetical protein
MTLQIDPRFQHAVREAKHLKGQLSTLVEMLEAKLAYCKNNGSSREENYWSVKLRLDCARRMEILCEEMGIVSTLNLLAVCRYAHELGIWLILASKKDRYSLLYGKMLLDALVEQSEGQLQQLEFEIATYEAIRKQEQEGIENAMKQLGSTSDPNVIQTFLDSIQQASSNADWKDWSRFMLYRKEASTNGYGFQAHLLRTKVIPEHQQRLTLHKQEQEEFKESWPNLVQEFGYKNDNKFTWNWKVQAAEAELSQEHEFLYSYVSRLLHAKPSSISAAPNDLSTDEILIFQAYTLLRIRVATEHIEHYVAALVNHYH